MFTPLNLWIVFMLGFWFTGGSLASLRANTAVDCKTPMPFEYGNADEGYSGTLEYIETPLQVSLSLESPSCPVCLSFLELSHTVGDSFAIVSTRTPLDADALTEHDGHFIYYIVCSTNGVRNLRTLTLNDINDNSPIFERHEYSVKASETLPVGSVVLQVKATDADATPEFNTIYYNIHPPSDTFDVTTDGSVILTKQLNYAVTTSYRFSVTAMDIGHLFDATTVIINVTGEIEDNEVVQIYINKHPNQVLKQVHDTERALERGLELWVMITDVGRSNSDSNALVSFIARENDVIVQTEILKGHLWDNNKKIQTELQGVFGPDTDFWMVEEDSGSGTNLGLALGLGITLPIIFIVVVVCCIRRYCRICRDNNWDGCEEY